MDMPSVRFATTTDGVRIAYWTLGNGPPLLLSPWTIYGNLEREWRIPRLRDWFIRLAKSFRIIRFDARHSGLSDRLSPGGYRAEDLALDAEALFDAIGVERPLFYGEHGPGLILVHHTARGRDSRPCRGRRHE